MDAQFIQPYKATAGSSQERRATMHLGCILARCRVRCSSSRFWWSNEPFIIRPSRPRRVLLRKPSEFLLLRAPTPAS
jgi:hypothetical protein